MSRTDKDAPYWAIAEYYEPEHRLYCENRQPRWAPDRRIEPCSLTPEPIRAGSHGWHRAQKCYWVPVWPRWGYHCWPYWSPRKDDRHFYWYGPMRAHDRDALRKAKKEYRGSGDCDPLTSRNHRHGKTRGWWD